MEVPRRKELAQDPIHHQGHYWQGSQVSWLPVQGSYTLSSFTHKYLLNTCCMPGTVLASGNHRDDKNRHKCLYLPLPPPPPSHHGANILGQSWGGGVVETNQINLQQLLSSLFISFLQQIFIENYISIRQTWS